MKIGIDINDTVRNFSEHTTTYLKNYFETYPPNVYKKALLNEKDDSYRLSKAFSFNDADEFNELIYSELSFELFGKAPLIDMQSMWHLNMLYKKLVLDGNSVTLFSQERMTSRAATFYFLGYNKCIANNVKFVHDYSKVWSIFDGIVTANPFIIKRYKETNKKKELYIITQDYNLQYNKGYRFNNLQEILNMPKNDNNRLLH